MKKLKFYDLFYLFLIGSVFGYFFEVIYTLIRRHTFVNHTALVIGPFNIIYGVSAVLLTIFLIKYQKSSYLKQFIVSFLLASVIEYIASWGMETIFGFTAWNYQRYFLNINGRICLIYSAAWGLLGIFWINYLYPKINKLIRKMNKNFGIKLMRILIPFLIFDFALSVSAVVRAKQKDAGVPAQNIYDKFLDNTFNRDYLKNMFNNHWK